MDGVTDAAMRKITAKYGQPSVIFTEFVSAEGIKAGAVRLLKELVYDQSERPVVAQLFGSDKEAFYLATLVVCALGFNGVDVNMGCPAKSVEGRGGGAGLIKKPGLAKEIVGEVKRAVGDWVNGVSLEDLGLNDELVNEVVRMRKMMGLKERKEIPVSVKTRIGYGSKEEMEKWMETVRSFEVAAVSLHGRTFKQSYGGEADWQLISEARKMFRGEKTVFLGNGDIKNRDEAERTVEKYGVDGVLIGRAARGNPSVFRGNGGMGWEERLRVAVEHAKVFKNIFGGEYFLPMRKHLAWYVRGFEGAGKLRTKLVRVNSADEAEDVIKEYL